MSAAPVKTYRAGSLIYNKRSLYRLFFWLLLGDFSMAVTASCLPRLLPLQLDHIGVKTADIGWMLSLGPLAAVILSPFIGIWSDRLRTRWGRRRPFLLVSTPIMALGLILIPHITDLTWLTVVVWIVQIANVLETVLYYLYADVVPPELMGRFMAAFRIVSTLGVLSFNYFLMPIFGMSPELAWAICGVSYLLFYQLSLHFVREGTYAEPEKENPVELARDYVKNGLGSKYIWLLWLALGTTAIASGAGAFMDLFSKNQLKLDMTTIGQISAWAALPSLLLMMPAGWLIDRYGPRVIWGSGCFLSGVLGIVGYFYVQDASTMLYYSIVSSCVGAFLGVALMPMLYAHLPKNRFGQMVSAQSLVVQMLIFFNTNSAAHVIAAFGDNYRIAFIYGAPFLILTPVFLYLGRIVKNPFRGEEFAMSNGSAAAKSH